MEKEDIAELKSLYSRFNTMKEELDKTQTKIFALIYKYDKDKSEDLVKSFLLSHYEITSDYKDKIKATRIYSNFKNTNKDSRLSNVKFYEIMKALGYEQKKFQGYQYYRNLKQYINDNNPVKDFIDSTIIKTDNEKDRIKAIDLYKLFKGKTQDDKTTSDKFYKDMSYNCFERSAKIGGYQYYYYVKIKEEQSVEEQDEE